MMNDSLLQNYWLKNFRPFSSSNPLSSSFLVHFKSFQAWWVCQLRLYKTFSYLKSKMQWSKIWNSKFYSILICLSMNIEPLTLNTPYLPHSFIKLNNFCGIANVRWKIMTIIWSSKTKIQCVRIQPPLISWVLTHQPTYNKINFSFQIALTLGFD